MAADFTQVIGHGHYEVRLDDNRNAATLGEDRFKDGEYDLERDKLELYAEDRVPRMVTFEHTFFSANGRPQREAKANFQTGLASATEQR
jgi:hypothetical protein